jgi:hypothetical protein
MVLPELIDFIIRRRGAMQNKAMAVRLAFVAMSGLFACSAYAFDMGNMMNPSKWMGGDKDRYDDYPRGPGYGYGGPGYYGGYPGYGGPGYGYGGYPGYPGPGYGYGGYPGYGGSPTIVVPGNRSSNSEVEQLKARIRELEGQVR